MSKLAEYRDFLQSVRSSIGYWKSYSLMQFTISLSRLMRQEKVSGKKLADRLVVSSAQVSKVLSGKENVTIETMAKFADALDAVVHIHVAKKGVSVRWVEEGREIQIVTASSGRVERARYAPAYLGAHVVAVPHSDSVLHVN